MAAGPDAAIAAAAARQHGNITREQLLALGVNDQAICHRVSRGHLHRIHRGVYAVGRPPVTPLERAAAAVLACGPAASLSHFGAAKLWGFAKRWPQSFDVTVPGDRRPPGIRTHRAPNLRRADRRRHMGIWLTSPARTLLDCAPALSEVKRARAVNDARLLHHLHTASLADVIGRFPRHPGAALLRPFVTTRGGPTRSEFEDGFQAFCERFDLPRPKTNTIVAGHLVDALFEAEKLIVELDGYEFHSDRGSFESDRDRDADTLAAGFPTVRITWERMIGTPDREATRFDAILKARRGTSRESGPAGRWPPPT